MVKKFKAPSQSDDEQLAEAVRASAQQIWQAGLGAFAKAHGSGGKVFAKLVREGTELQQQTRQLVEGKASGAKSAVGKAAGVVGKRASGSWDKLEQVFEDRVARSLQRLGVPSQREIDLLTKRVDQLSKAVAALSGKRNPTTKAVAKSATPKATAKKTAKKASGVPTKARPATKPAARKSVNRMLDNHDGVMTGRQSSGLMQMASVQSPRSHPVRFINDILAEERE